MIPSGFLPIANHLWHPPSLLESRVSGLCS